MHNQPFKISRYQVTPAEFSIKVNDDEKYSLQPKFIEVLVYLAKHHGRVVPRSELIDHIWGTDSFVGEKSLTNAIWHLRKTLTKVEGEEEVIKTIRKAGYQLMPKPQWRQDNPLLSTTSPSEPISSSINYSIDSTIESSVDNSLYQKHTLNKNLATKSIKGRTKITKKQALFALAILLLSLFFITSFSNEQNPSITTITKHPGSELFPAPSPNGRFVVYSQVLSNQPINLFMKDTHQLALPPKQLTFDNAIERQSVWSNDGQYLYFARKDKANKSCYYIQLKVASQQETPIATCPMQGGYYYLDISPDNKILAVYNRSISAKRSGIYFIDLTSKNFTMTRFSCDTSCQYKDRDMAFSPDGKYIAVARRLNRLSENIYLINLATNVTTQLTFDEEDIVGMSWFSGNKKLVFAAQRADTRSGYMIDINNKVKKPLHLPGFSYPSIAKHSQQLYYQERKENSSLVSLQLNDTIANSPFPVLQSNFTYESPDYNPATNLMVFSSNESGFDELWSAKVDGSARKQLTNLQQTIRHPKWSHDGKKVAFLAPLSQGSGAGIYIYSIENEKVTLLKSPFVQHNRPTWSLDDTKIISAIYGDKHTDIYSITIADGVTKRLTFDSARYGVMINADTLLYTKLKTGLWQKNINNDQAAKKIINGSLFNTLYSWTYQNGQIYYQKIFNDHYQLIAYDLVNQIQSPLVKLPLNSISLSDSISYIASEDRLLYTSSSYPQANIKMITTNHLH